MGFTEKQQELSQARTQRESSKRELFKAKEKLNRTRREIDRLSRFAGEGENVAKARLLKLKGKEAELTGTIDQLTGELNTSKGAELDGIKAFYPFTDPTENISRLDDGYPILMFPLRIETRFKIIGVAGGGIQHQLWVRVFPDEIAIDTFEELLSENEVRNARSYWCAMWRAGDVEDDQRAAWRSLVGNHGSGRAYWIVQNYLPINEADKPERKNSDKIILVIGTDNPPEANELEPVKTFWKSLWLARDDREKQEAARQQLVTQVGAPRATEIQEEYEPYNFADKPPASLTYNEVTLEVAFVIFPAPDDVDTKYQAWASAAKVRLLPERLVLLGFNDGDENSPLQVIGHPIPSPLTAGPDPSAEEGEQFNIAESDQVIDGKSYKKGDLIVAEDMKWMVDFEEAVAKGMGFKIDLTPEQADNGFDRLFVLGVRLSTDKDEGRNAVENLIERHHKSRKGFAILAQGTPTNNTEKEGSSYSWREDSDDSFDIYFKKQTPDDPRGWFDKRDGRWLAEILGIDTKCLRNVDNYYGTDQREARAMNTALWPATLGYFMETMMAPVFSDQVISQTKSFFQSYVSGRGMIPAIRVGKQPYGILSATPFSRMTWLQARTRFTHAALTTSIGGQHSYLQALYYVLGKIDNAWIELLDKVSHVRNGGDDAHQILLDIVGLNPASVEYYYRHAQSLEQIYNSFNIKGLGAAFKALMIAIGYQQNGLDLLSDYGYTAQGDEDIPDILQKFFFGRSDLLKGPIIDDVPLSESDQIRVYTGNNKNYIQWLIDAARNSHDTLRKQNGFIDDKPPAALLYLMLHHALDLGYLDASLRLHFSAGIFDNSQLLAGRIEPKFIHVQDPNNDPGSRWKHLYKPEPQITASDNLLISDYIPTIINNRPETATLREQLSALDHLKDAPTARLERVFTEHLDTCSYRLDAWMLGLVNAQLAIMRGIAPDKVDDSSIRRGLYIGAYGWLEDVRSEDKSLTPALIAPELEDIFADPNHRLMVDDSNGGYIHAPSLNHAVTAAVLRNGYIANATKDNPTSLEVNLSSERVRLALSIIEGIRSGQPLAALLGYQLERGMHDRHDCEVDEFIYDLRKAFPLVANRMTPTKEANLEDIRKVEARNVIDGLALIEQIEKSGEKTYPFGRSDLPTAGSKQKKAIKAEVERIININDAVADLALAEGVHQVVQGNYDRAAATLDAYSKGSLPPTPDVIRTPRSGVTLTHRAGLQFKSGLNPGDAANTTPRSMAEPAINSWLADILQDMNDIICTAEIYDPGTDSTSSAPVTMKDLGLLPIDLLYTGQLENEQAMTFLDDAIVLYILQNNVLNPDVQIKIKYTEHVAGKLSLFELTPLLNSLRALIIRSRPLEAGDVKLAVETKQANEADSSINPLKITLVRDALSGLNTQLGNYVTAISPVLDWTIARSGFASENLVLSLLDEGILETIENDTDHVRFDISITNEGRLKSLLGQIAGIQVNPIITIWQPILAKYNIITTNIDSYINNAATIYGEISRFGLPQTGSGFLLDWKRQQYVLLSRKINELITRWEENLIKFNALITEYNNLPPTATREEKLALLHQAERLISTEITVNLPANPDDFRDDLSDTGSNSKKTKFENKLNNIKGLLSSSTLADLYNDIDTVCADIPDYDLTGLDIEKEKKQLLIFAQDLLQGAKNLQADLGKRLQQVAGLLPANDADIDPKKHKKELLQAGEVLLGEDFKIVPEFSLAEEQGDEWANAYSMRAKLLKYQENTLGEEFPVDSWLYGIARVREKMHHLENTTILADTLVQKDLKLEPVQFPYHQEDYWLAMEYPEKLTDGTKFVIDEDKLLYTAYYAEGFSKTKKQCGLLIDEWTEVIPTEEETTGLTFHYDRPNAEPPQALLLVTPSEFRQSWQWQDIVDTLHDTLDMAKKRAIEPGHIDSTDYARFLPALISAESIYPITAQMNLALNNQIYEVIIDNE